MSLSERMHKLNTDLDSVLRHQVAYPKNLNPDEKLGPDPGNVRTSLFLPSPSLFVRVLASVGSGERRSAYSGAVSIVPELLSTKLYPEIEAEEERLRSTAAATQSADLPVRERIRHHQVRLFLLVAGGRQGCCAR